MLKSEDAVCLSVNCWKKSSQPERGALFEIGLLLRTILSALSGRRCNVQWTLFLPHYGFLFGVCCRGCCPNSGGD